MDAQKELYHAVANGNLTRVQQVLAGKDHIDIDIKTLAQAVEKNRIDILQAFIGHDPHSLKRSLFAANENTETKTLKFLLAHGADVNLRDSDIGGAAPLEVIFSGMRISFPNSSRGATPLNYAAARGIEGLVRFLLDHKADLDVQDDDGNTALCNAIQNEHTKIAQMLILEGAALDLTANSGQTPLHYACQKCYPEIVDLILEKMATTGKVGTALKSQDQDGCIPLHYAIYPRYRAPGGNALATAKSLINATMNKNEFLQIINIQDKNKTSPLMSVIKHDNESVLELFIGKGLEVNARGSYNNTLLHYAARHNRSKDVIKLLTSNGADLNAKNDRGLTPIELAGKLGNYEAVAELDYARETRRFVNFVADEEKRRSKKGKTDLPDHSGQ